MTTGTTLHPLKSETTPEKLVFISDCLASVCSTLESSRLGLQQLIDKIYSHTIFAIPQPKDRKQCIERTLEFRFAISDLIASFWESSGNLVEDCEGIRKQIAMQENPLHVDALKASDTALLLESRQLHHHASVLFAQICVIHQATNICSILFMAILEQKIGTFKQPEDSPGKAIAELLTHINQQPKNHQQTLIATQLHNLQYAFLAAAKLLHHHILNSDFASIPEAISQIEDSMQALYSSLSVFIPNPTTTI